MHTVGGLYSKYCNLRTWLVCNTNRPLSFGKFGPSLKKKRSKSESNLWFLRRFDWNVNNPQSARVGRAPLSIGFNGKK